MNRITRGLATSAAALALAVGGLAVTAQPASAAKDTPNHVSKVEFRKVHKGMTKKRVHQIFDVPGKQSYFMSGSKWWPAEQWREYRVKSRWGSVEVDYQKKKGVWRVSSKYAYWG